jgi:hypothetical protein
MERGIGRRGVHVSVRQKEPSLRVPRYMAHGNDGRAVGAALTRQSLAIQTTTCNGSGRLIVIALYIKGKTYLYRSGGGGGEETKRALPTEKAKKTQRPFGGNYSMGERKTKRCFWFSFSFVCFCCYAMRRRPVSDRGCVCPM